MVWTTTFNVTLYCMQYWIILNVKNMQTLFAISDILSYSRQGQHFYCQIVFVLNVFMTRSWCNVRAQPINFVNISVATWCCMVLCSNNRVKAWFYHMLEKFIFINFRSTNQIKIIHINHEVCIYIQKLIQKWL